MLLCCAEDMHVYVSLVWRLRLQKYEELDDQVQTAFDAYLVERGIDADFGEYLMKLAADKEQRECVLTLHVALMCHHQA